MAQQDNKPTVLVAVLAVAGLGASAFVFLLMGGPAEDTERPTPAPANAVAVAEPGGDMPATAPEPAPAPVPAAGPRPASPPQAEAGDRMARDLERQRIWSSLRREHGLTPAKPGAAAPDPEAAAQLPALDPAYIKAAIAEQLVPIAIECYESALEDEPALAGKLITNFTIVGAEDIGGIVEDATIAEESTLESAFVRECMRESLMAVSFDPPTDGGRVEVTYPFVFEPDPAE